MNKAIFFDRDGTLIKSYVCNDKLRAIRNIGELEIYPNARKILSYLKSKKYKLILVTNQPDVAQGLVSKYFVENINSFLNMHLGLDLIKVAYEPEEGDPNRYKPGPGMLFEAANELNIDLAQSFIIGDRWRDIGAGINAGCQTILIETQNIEDIKYSPNFRIKSLEELVSIIN